MRTLMLVVVAALVAASTACGASLEGGDEPAAGDGVHPLDWPEVMAACVRDQGFDAEVEWDGAVIFGDIPDEQGRDLEAAVDRCEARHPLAAKYAVPLDDAQLRWLYDWFTTVSIPCLVDEGYSGFDPPSVEVFVSTYHVPGADVWTPYNELTRRMEPAQLPQEVQLRCPQNPDPDELFDDHG